MARLIAHDSGKPDPADPARDRITPEILHREPSRDSPAGLKMATPGPRGGRYR